MTHGATEDGVAAARLVNRARAAAEVASLERAAVAAATGMTTATTTTIAGTMMATYPPRENARPTFPTPTRSTFSSTQWTFTPPKSTHCSLSGLELRSTMPEPTIATFQRAVPMDVCYLISPCERRTPTTLWTHHLTPLRHSKNSGTPTQTRVWTSPTLTCSNSPSSSPPGVNLEHQALIARRDRL